MEIINALFDYSENNALLDLGEMFLGFTLLPNMKCYLNSTWLRIIQVILVSATIPRYTEYFRMFFLFVCFV